MATIFVKHDASGANDGSSWADAYTDLQNALDGASALDEVWVAGGTYTPTDVPAVSPAGTKYQTFQMVAGVGIYGGFVGTETLLTERAWLTNETILSGELGATDACHVIFNDSTLALDDTAILDGFTVSGGYASDAGIYLNGAGIYNDQCDPTVRNCKIKDNYAGGVGAGIYSLDCQPKFTNCIVEDNTTDGDGGNVETVGATTDVVMEGCLIADNVGATVGGAYIASGTLQLINTTVAGNTVSSSSSSAGGIKNDGTLSLKNAIVFENTNNASGPSDILNNGTVTTSYSCYSTSTDNVTKGVDWTETSPVNSNPNFGTGTYIPISSSLCISAGLNANVTAGIVIDVINNYRFSGGTCDIGAYEYQWTVSVKYYAGDNGSLTGDADQTVAYHSSGTAITAVDDSGYTFTAWSDGDTNNPRTDITITGDISVTALFVLDDITVTEQILSREVIANKSATLIYQAKGSSDQSAIIDALKVNSPATFVGLARNDIHITPEHVDTDNEETCLWTAQIDYRVYSQIIPDTNTSTYSFDTTGGETNHITQAIATTTTLPESDEKKHKHKNAINYDGETVHGLDITAPVFKFSETHYFANDKVNNSLKANIFRATNKVNDGSFRTYSKGEVMFLGASGSRVTGENWQIQFNFAAVPNRNAVEVDGLGFVPKKGWEYISVRYKQVSDENGMTVVPEQADVLQIREFINFGILGI